MHQPARCQPAPLWVSPSAYSQQAVEGYDEK